MNKYNNDYGYPDGSGTMYYSNGTIRKGLWEKGIFKGGTSPPFHDPKDRLNFDQCKCRICFDNKVNQAFQCGHVCCDECFEQIKQTNNTCHECRRYITDAIKIYI